MGLPLLVGFVAAGVFVAGVGVSVAGAGVSCFVAEQPEPIQLLEYQRGGVCLFYINLAQEARQSKPPLMHCADWAYNIIPAVTALAKPTFLLPAGNAAE